MHRIMSRARTRTVALLGSLSIALVATIGAPGASLAATTHPCRVTNVRTGVTYGVFQRAAAKAKDGDTLKLRGTCSGEVEILRDLTIVGVRTRATGVPTVTGNKKTRVMVLAYNVAVTLKNLVIRDGRTAELQGAAFGAGAGIWAPADLTLINVTLRDNKVTSAAGFGGAIWTNPITDVATLKILGRSRLFGNSAPNGGAISFGGNITIGGTTRIDHNTAGGVGGAIRVQGTLLLKGSARIDHNTAGGTGGGIAANSDLDILQLTEQAVVELNTAGAQGGGIDGTVSVLSDDAEIRDNTAGAAGGGVFGDAPLDTCGTSIHDNTPDDCAS